MNQIDTDAILSQIVEFATKYGIRVLGAIVILVVGRIASRVFSKATRTALEKRQTAPGITGFVSSLVRWGVLTFAVVAAISQFGVQTASIVAVLGAAGFAVGMALQGALGNFAAGVLILLFRPFRVGDYVDAAGSRGEVAEIGIFTTTLNTPDNQKIIIPNGAIISGTITNVNAYDTRRVDLVAGIGYGDDIAKARSVLETLVGRHPRVLKDPAPVIEVSELADSSVNFVVRPWVNTPDYWTVFFDLTQSIKEEFDRNGISIPFPQRDVHMHEAN